LAEVIGKFTERVGLKEFAVYVFDYGAPTGFRLALNHPERITALISQNGNAYEEGLSKDWAPVRAYWENPTQQNRDVLRSLSTLETTRWQYHHGVTNAEQRVAPEAIILDQALLDRPQSAEIQLDLIGNYKSNVALYLQHRGGPLGFVKVLGSNLIGFADFKGNRQLVSTGNLDVTDRVALFMMDSASHTAQAARPRSHARRPRASRVGRSTHPRVAPQQSGAIVPDPGHFLRLKLSAIHHPAVHRRRGRKVHSRQPVHHESHRLLQIVTNHRPRELP
jgi:pimeloyl-ACP methyl ester carboxylesterase